MLQSLLLTGIDGDRPSVRSVDTLEVSSESWTSTSRDSLRGRAWRSFSFGNRAVCADSARPHIVANTRTSVTRDDDPARGDVRVVGSDLWSQTDRPQPASSPQRTERQVAAGQLVLDLDDLNLVDIDVPDGGYLSSSAVAMNDAGQIAARSVTASGSFYPTATKWDPADCPEDINGDGVVDVEDLLILLSGWG